LGDESRSGRGRQNKEDGAVAFVEREGLAYMVPRPPIAGAGLPVLAIGYGVYWLDGLREPRVEAGATFASLRFRTTLTMHYVNSKETPPMKYPVALAAILSTAALVTLGTAAGFPQRVYYIDHDKVAAAFVKGGRIIEDQGLIVIAQRVVGRGSEMHDSINHVFIIMDGEAEFITGGKLVDPKATEPGQTRGTGIEGGVSHHLTKGDVITIPAKTPHQWKDTSKTGSVGYFAVNLESN